MTGRLPGAAIGEAPVWDLCEWSSRFPLEPGPPKITPDGSRRWANEAKSVSIADGQLSLGVNASIEYDGRARKQGEPWVHLLIQQEFPNPPSIARLRGARLRMEARLIQSRRHRTPDYSRDLHAAQFQLFLTLQNRNRQSSGFGKLVWFGVPLYDDRSRSPREHKTRDTGGTGMFIFTPAGDTFTRQSAHDGDWIRIDRHLVSLFREALETAWQRQFLTESRDLNDYLVSGMNLGWEVPGILDVGMQVRGLSLEADTD